MKKQILEAIQKGISKSFNFEVDSEDEGSFKIKKSKLQPKSNDIWAYEQYQEKYRELIEKKDFKGCLDLYNSRELNQKSRTIGYKPESKEELKNLVKNFDDINYDGFDLNWIDVSEITDMSELFQFMPAFNCDISEWNVSNVTDMHQMFYWCKSFNSSLSSWIVSNVNDMHQMFYNCINFNQDLSNWNVSNVNDMSDVFDRCENFNSDLSSWDVSNVTNMSFMLYRCEKFNSDLSSWDVFKVENMDCMFEDCPIKEKNKPNFR